MLLLDNPVQPYPWGPIDGLVGLVGSDPTGDHEAELWVGTHPGAPSYVIGDPAGRTLAAVIEADPIHWLGEHLAATGARALPFLLKILAVGSPLSLQAHPSADQAAAGYAREEALGLALGDPTRTYRDPNPKPEALVALVETWALCGFRSPDQAADLVEAMDREELVPLVGYLRGADPLREALAWLLHLSGAERVAVAEAVAGPATALDPARSDTWGPAWTERLAAEYPGDPAAIAPLLLEVVRLAPGDAVHLPAGNLHAYLTGAGVEIMAASDNVLRGGLTSKHVDIDELLHVVRFEPGTPPGPVRTTAGRTTRYEMGERAFALAGIAPGEEPERWEADGPALLLATGGPVDVAGVEHGVTIDHGCAAFLAAGEGPVAVSGPGHLWCATAGCGS